MLIAPLKQWIYSNQQRLLCCRPVSGLESSHYVNIVRFNEPGSPWSVQTHSAFGEIMGEALNLRGTSLGGISGQLPVSSLGFYCIITLDEGLA